MDDHGIDVTVDGETYRLVPTLEAAQKLSRHFGGFANMIGIVQKVDIDAQVAIIQVGAGLTAGESKGLWEALWRSGDYQAVAAPLTQYLGILLNGGKPLDAPKDKAADKGN